MIRILFLTLFFGVLTCQASIDSLENLAANSKDTVRIKALIELSRQYRKKDLNKALTFAQTALKESQEQHFELCEARSHYAVGGTYRLMSDYHKAFDALYTALHLFKKVNYLSGHAEALNVIGLTHYGNSNFDSAVYYYRLYLDYVLKTNATTKLPIAYNNIAGVYYTQKNFKKAIEYFNEAIKKCKELGQEVHLSTMYNNLGAIYDDLNDFPSAKKHFYEALMYAKKVNDLKQQGAAHNNLGVLYRGLNTADSALFHFKRSEELNATIGDREGVALAILNIGALHTLKKEFGKATVVLEQSLKMAKEIGDPTLMRDVYRSLGEAYTGTGQFDKAALSFKTSGALTDSLFNEENSRQINEMQAKYDTQKKENEIALLNKDNKLKEEESKKQNIILNSIAAGFVLIIALAFVLIRSNKLQRRANEELTLKKAEIEKAYDLINLANIQITAKNEEITDSIKYAKRIQLSILPEPNTLQEIFPQSFIIYKPKDIVSGDFYWFGKIGNKKILAVADCTGHGVPGALMSMICHEKLLESLEENKAVDPAQVLSILDKKVVKTLRQDDSFESAKDGMDIALLFIDETKNQLHFAGANRPLLYFTPSTGELKAHKPTKASIGGRSENKAGFESLTLEYQKDDSIYLFSDGFADQVGGPKSKKLLSKNFISQIQSLAGSSLSEQGQHLDTYFEDWRGKHEQVDDVLVAGLKL